MPAVSVSWNCTRRRSRYSLATGTFYSGAAAGPRRRRPSAPRGSAGGRVGLRAARGGHRRLRS